MQLHKVRMAPPRGGARASNRRDETAGCRRGRGHGYRRGSDPPGCLHARATRGQIVPAGRRTVVRPPSPLIEETRAMTGTDSDSHNLRRFLTAQDKVIDRVRAELRAGHKTTHWMWFIFPQIGGLGHSDTARFYAIASRDEASAYLAHPVLGARLIDCTRIVLGVTGRSAPDIFGTVDAAKFRSCMTLFGAVAADPAPFRQALGQYFDGAPDKATLIRL